MTATQAKLLWAGGMLAVAWFFREKKTPDASGTVELGVPTVDGVYGNDVYWSKRGTVAPPDDNPAEDPTMRDLIDQSNAAIRAAGGYP